MKTEEYILCAAIRLKFSRVLICGHRHGDCYATLEHLNKKVNLTFSRQGFLTSRNRFVNRKEAAKIAFKAKQIQKETDILISEDLY